MLCVCTLRGAVRMSSLNGFTAILKRHINFNASIINSSLNSSSSCLAFRMSSSQVQGNSCVDGRTYKDAIRTLNELQSNADVIKIITANRTSLQADSLPGTVKYLARAGVQLEELDRLRIIHVAGTKGKGSTCAFLESILRHAGLKTGFFSSPHLISARERIRLDGKPLTHGKFTDYFFDSYDGMNRLKSDPKDMPSYFRFMTCMAFKVFLKENVDVAVVEVGIGGMYDSTNIIRKPSVVGITALGLDHQTILGETPEEIALQKAGIMKPGVPALTVPTHSPSVRKVLEYHATEVQAPLFIAPHLEEYGNPKSIELGIGNAEISGMNAALAIQLANAFLSNNFPEKLADHANRNIPFELGKPYPLQPWHFSGLRNCVWPGRFQILPRSQSLVFYLDGAHTLESFSAAVNWFRNVSPADSIRVLVFHLTGFRKADDLLDIFVKSGAFEHVIFCPIVVSTNAPSTSDNWSKVESEEDLRKKCQSHADAWVRLEAESAVTEKAKLMICDSLESMLKHVESFSKDQFSSTGRRVSILVTGSLHLVGTFLSVIDPQACD